MNTTRNGFGAICRMKTALRSVTRLAMFLVGSSLLRSNGVPDNRQSDRKLGARTGRAALAPLDGKTLRGSRGKTGKALHVVHTLDVWLQQLLRMAWVDQKQNEVTVLPDILRSLDLRGSVITMAVMGAQKTLFNPCYPAYFRVHGSPFYVLATG